MTSYTVADTSLELLQVEQDPASREIISNVTRQVLQSSNRAKLMDELSPQDKEKSQPMSEETKDIIVEQGHVEVLKLSESTDKIQCERCHKYMSDGQTYCHCVKSKIKKHVIRQRMPSEASKGYRVKISMVQAQKHKNIFKAKDALESVRNKCYFTILEPHKDDTTHTGKWGLS